MPLDALEGHLPEGRMTRANLLQGGIAGLLNIHARRLLGFEQVFEVARDSPRVTSLVVIEASSTPDPWLGRWVDQHGRDDHPLQAVTIGDRISDSLLTRDNPVAVVPAFAQDGYELKPMVLQARTLPSNLRLAARLLSADLGVRILTTRYTGELTGLSDTFDAFRADLQARGIADEVVTVINTTRTSAAIRQQVLAEWLS